MTGADGLFDRRDGADAEERRKNLRRRRTLREAASRIAANADFQLWLYATLDDLRLFDRDEAEVDAFGQGFRAAARRIATRLCDSQEGAALIADLYKTSISATHKALVASRTREGGKDNE